MSLVGYSPWDRKELGTTEQLHWLTRLQTKSDATQPAHGQRLQHSRPTVNACCVRGKMGHTPFLQSGQAYCCNQRGSSGKEREDVQPNFPLASSDVTILTISGTLTALLVVFANFHFSK